MPGEALSVHREKPVATEFPDLNPLDYHVWDVLSEAVYRQRRDKFASTDELKTAIMAAWEVVSLGTIKKSSDLWKPRLRAVVEADGGPISHIFRKTAGQKMCFYMP